MTLASSSGPSLGCHVRGCISAVRLRAGPPHDVAAFVLALGFEVQDALFKHEGARGIPEVQAEDLALAREEVVLNAEPLHGLEMALQHGGGDQVGDCRGLVAAMFERVERVQADLFAARQLGGAAGSARRDRCPHTTG